MHELKKTSQERIADQSDERKMGVFLQHIVDGTLPEDFLENSLDIELAQLRTYIETFTRDSKTRGNLLPALARSYAQLTIMNRTFYTVHDLMTMLGLEASDISHIRTFAYQHCNLKEFTQAFVRSCELLDTILHDPTPHILSQSIINRRKRESIDQYRYGLERLRSPNRIQYGGYILGPTGFYLDGPLALALTYDTEPVAMVSFSASNIETLLVQQMQGRKNMKRKSGLFDLDWRGVLLDVLGYYALETSFTYLGIASGVNNHWVKEGHIAIEDALKAYDEQAKRLGFILNTEKSIWEKAM